MNNFIGFITLGGLAVNYFLSIYGLIKPIETTKWSLLMFGPIVAMFGILTIFFSVPILMYYFTSDLHDVIASDASPHVR